MSESSASRLFRDLVERPDAEIDLAQAALAVAADEYPGLDADGYQRRLDQLARAVERVAEGSDPLARLGALIDRLGRVERFRGNRDHYNDPRNSFLSDVLDRRTGIPLSLSLVYVIVGRRAGLSMEGVAFPGHFLARCDLDDGFVILDAFDGGRQLALDDCERLLHAIRRDASFDRELLEPASHRAILFRMLANLKGAWLAADEAPRALRTIERMLVIAPDHPGLLRDRGQVFFQLGRFPEALADLERYQELAPVRAAEDRAAAAWAALARRRRLSLN